MIAVADTGFVLAVTLVTDKWHQACLPIYQQQQTIYLPQSTLAETAFMLTQAGGNLLTAGFLAGLKQSQLRMLALTAEDITRTAELLEQYADSRLDFVDASVVAVAERLNITRILTVDQRDFRLVRPRHCDYFELLPER